MTALNLPAPVLQLGPSLLPSPKTANASACLHRPLVNFEPSLHLLEVHRNSHLPLLILDQLSLVAGPHPMAICSRARHLRIPRHLPHLVGQGTPTLVVVKGALYHQRVQRRCPYLYHLMPMIY